MIEKYGDKKEEEEMDEEEEEDEEVKEKYKRPRDLTPSNYNLFAFFEMKNLLSHRLLEILVVH